MIGIPFLALGLLLVLSALAGARVQGRDRGPIGAFLLSPLHPATWQATFAIVAGFLVELLFFILVSGAFSAGVSLLVVGIGVAIVALGIETSRFFARLERRRAMSADRRPLLAHPYRPYGSGLGDLLSALFLDLSRWRDVLYVFIALPLAILEFVIVVVLWVAAFALISVPFIGVSAQLGPLVAGTMVTPEAVAVVAVVAGIILLPIAASVSQGLMALHRAVVAGLLCTSEAALLQQRVQTLEGSRRAVIDVEASELRRIERDLHDGAQQRLVMLTIDLGLAAEKLDTDPDGARALVLDAQGQARQALAELRDLVRGIAPAILLDRGLVPALSALAGRSPVPTAVNSTLPEGERLPDSVERAAYFVVAEALANVAKHGAATRCEIRCRGEWGRLIVEVWDDGAGGAKVLPGGGLAGGAGGGAALAGRVEVHRQPGGPTTVRAEIPVAAGQRVASPPPQGPPAAPPPGTVVATPPGPVAAPTYWTRPDQESR